MPFLDHLEELRWRILYSLLAVVLCTLVGWLIVERVDVIGLLTRPIAPLIPGGKLRVRSPTEPFFITLKFAFVLGLLLASPVVIYQAWAFLAPALYARERRLIVPALSVGVLLFLGGAAVAYQWVLPRALAVLLSFQRNVFDPLITADKYFAFAAQLIIAFGVVTELPLVIVILASLGLVTPQFLARHRRYALVLAAVAAALLTPPDAVSMLLMMVPLVLLYEVSIWCAWVVTRRRARRAQAAARAGVVLLMLCGLGAGRLAAQGVVPRRRTALPPPSDSTARAGAPGRGAPHGQSLDTAAARPLRLPTGPTRSFPPGDAVMDSLLKLKGYRVTQYVADTLIVQGDSQTIFLRGESFVDRQGTKLEADSIRYREASCRLDAAGDPRLFDQGTVLVGEGMRYDTCIRRGTVRNPSLLGGPGKFRRPAGLGRWVGEPLRVAPRADALPLVGSLSLRHLLVLPRGSARRRRTLEPLRVAAPAELLQPDALQREHRLRDERERHSDQRRGSLRRDRTADLAGELRQALRLGHPQRRRQPVAEPDQ